MKKALSLLYLSFDKRLSAKEESKLRSSLSQSEELRREMVRIEKLRRAISQAAVDSFEPFFVERVMARIEEERAKPEIFFGSLYRAFRWAMIPSLALLLGIFIKNISYADDFSIRAAIGLPDFTVGDAFEPQTDFFVVDVR